MPYATCRNCAKTYELPAGLHTGKVTIAYCPDPDCKKVWQERVAEESLHEFIEGPPLDWDGLLDSIRAAEKNWLLDDKIDLAVRNEAAKKPKQGNKPEERP